MSLPDLRNDNLSAFLARAEVVQETAEQIMKGFGMFGIEITFSGDTEHAYTELHAQLVDQVGRLMSRDYDRLLSVLYHVDISERQIARAAREIPEYNHIEIIAHQIIFRELQKVLMRRYFRSRK